MTIQSNTESKVAIITVTYNSADFIDQYLESVAEFLRGSAHKLFLVDNQSSDNTIEIATQFADEQGLSTQIHIIPAGDNLGFGKGCNLGAEHAKAHEPSHLWFLNPDTKIFGDTGAALLKLMHDKPEVDFVGSTLVDKDSNPRAGAFRFPTALNVLLSTTCLGILDKIFKRHTTAIPLSDAPVPADWLTGASFMVKRECFESLEGFDPFYFLYFEEVDLFFRAKEKGFTVMTCPASKVFHISGASTGINNKQTVVKRKPSYWFESRRYFYIKNYGKAYFLLVDALFFFGFATWKLRAFIQKKEKQTAQYLVRDTFKHSLLAKFN